VGWAFEGVKKTQKVQPSQQVEHGSLRSLY